VRALTAVAAALLLALPLAAKTLNVGPVAKYQDIQAALKAAKAGDVVSVAAGFYRVPNGIQVNKHDVTLQGAGADRTILDGRDSADMLVDIYTNGVTVTGFTLQNGAGSGVHISGPNWCNIHHNVIIGNADCGILLGFGTLYAVVDHNTFANNRKAAMYSYSDDPRTEFTNNIVTENGRSIMTDSTTSHMAVQYNCFWGRSYDSVAAITNSTNLRADPLLVDPPNDLNLQRGSPCLGKGQSGSDIGALGAAYSPAVEKPATKEASGKYRVLVYANNNDLAERVLNLLRAAGFANNKSHVGDWPNNNANIKYGAATKDDITAMRKLVSTVYDSNLEESREFESDNLDIFINLP
jgi:hypothetical protein